MGPQPSSHPAGAREGPTRPQNAYAIDPSLGSPPQAKAVASDGSPADYHHRHSARLAQQQQHPQHPQHPQQRYPQQPAHLHTSPDPPSDSAGRAAHYAQLDMMPDSAQFAGHQHHHHPHQHPQHQHFGTRPENPSTPLHAGASASHLMGLPSMARTASRHSLPGGAQQGSAAVAAGMPEMAAGLAAGMPAGPSSAPQSRKRKSLQLSGSPLTSGRLLGDSDGDLKRLAHETIETPMDDLIKAMREDNEGAGTEKTRQLFGMSWLLRNCELQVDANVPRNRIYARYVSLCSDCNLKPLNPASFGKLVRTLYPNIKTRRLGVRGQSKYHYCGIRLVGEQNNATGDTPVGTPGRFGQASPDVFAMRPPYITPGDSSPGAGNSSFMGSYSPYDSPNPGQQYFNQSQASPREPFTAKKERSANSSFSDFANISLATQHQEFAIPPLEPYLDLNTDRDAASTLFALYKTHCRSLIEALRFMHVKKFLDILSGFMGGMTSPVQRLFKQQGISAWVSEVDWIMYKEMVHLLSPLSLQEIPLEVQNGLRSLCLHLPDHIASVLANMPSQFVAARLRPARTFARLLARLLRANESALNAGKILVNADEVTKMRQDWLKHVDVKAVVAREVPCAGLRVVEILEEGVVQLLSPSGDLPVGPKGSLFGMSKSLPEQSVDGEQGDNDGERKPLNGGMNGYTMSEASIVKWAQFLSALPARFPNVSPRMFLLYMSSVLTCTLRDISMGGGEGFGAWWVVRCWIDDWMGWTAEMGGFLAYGGQDMSMAHPDEFVMGTVPDEFATIRLAFPATTRNFRSDSSFDGVLDDDESHARNGNGSYEAEESSNGGSKQPTAPKAKTSNGDLLPSEELASAPSMAEDLIAGGSDADDGKLA